MKKAIAPRINTNTAKFYQLCFKNLNSGATYALESFPGLYMKSLEKMKGMFEPNELKFIVELNMSTMLIPGLAGEHLAGNVSVEFECGDKKWKEEILKKISKLDLFQRSCLEIWAKSFWYRAGEKDLESWIQQFPTPL